MSKSLVKNQIQKGEGVKSEKSSDDDAPYKLKVYHKFVEFYSLPDPEQAEFLSIPYNDKLKKFERPATLKEFAKAYGVHQDTLTNWKKRDDFIVAVDSKRREWGKDRTANVLSSLYRRCIKYGMSYDVETYLAFYEGWDKKKVIEASGTKFDMDDIRALIAPLPKDKQEKFYAVITQIITEAQSARGDSEVQGDQLDESDTDQK